MPEISIPFPAMRWCDRFLTWSYGGQHQQGKMKCRFCKWSFISLDLRIDLRHTKVYTHEMAEISSSLRFQSKTWKKRFWNLNRPKIIIVIIFGFKERTTSATFSYCAGWCLENKTLNILWQIRRKPKGIPYLFPALDHVIIINLHKVEVRCDELTLKGERGPLSV